MEFKEMSLFFQKIKSVFVPAILAVAMMTVSTSCLREEVEPPKSIEELREENGYPVTVEVIEPMKFDKEMSFFANVEAKSQTSEFSKVGDKILKLNVQLGDYVKEGDVLVEFPTDNPTMQFDQAKLAYENSKKTYERMKKLLEAGEISQQNFDDISTKYEVDKKNFEQMKQILFVEAPTDGRIINLPVKVNDHVRFDKELFTIGRTERMLATINVSDEELPYISRGMKASVSWNGDKLEGTVTKVGMTMNQMTRSFPVEVEIPNKGNILKSGMTVKVSISIDRQDDAIIIPRNFVRTEGNMHFVFLEEGGKALKMPVEVSGESGINFRIRNGLKYGDRIINCCGNVLEDGLKVNVTN